MKTKTNNKPHREKEHKESAFLVSHTLFFFVFFLTPDCTRSNERQYTYLRNHPLTDGRGDVGSPLSGGGVVVHQRLVQGGVFLFVVAAHAARAISWFPKHEMLACHAEHVFSVDERLELATHLPDPRPLGLLPTCLWDNRDNHLRPVVRVERAGLCCTVKLRNHTSIVSATGAAEPPPIEESASGASTSASTCWTSLTSLITLVCVLAVHTLGVVFVFRPPRAGVLTKGFSFSLKRFSFRLTE